MECFYSFDKIFNISNEDFFAQFVYVTQETHESSETPDSSTSLEVEKIIQNNFLIDEWIEDITTYKDSELDKLNELYNYLRYSDNDSYLYQIFEDFQSTLTIEKNEILEDIYIRRKVLDVINNFGITAYIPKYIQNLKS